MKQSKHGEPERLFGPTKGCGYLGLLRALDNEQQVRRGLTLFICFVADSEVQFSKVQVQGEGCFAKAVLRPIATNIALLKACLQLLSSNSGFEYHCHCSLPTLES